jgi:hypothetical protein
MYYTDYHTAKIYHNARQAELARAAHNDRPLHLSKSASGGIGGWALDKLGNGLTGMGKVLKGELASSS